MEQTQDDIRKKAKCYVCRRLYGDAYGFPDLVIEDWAWKSIAPKEGGGGLLCPCCIIEKLYKLCIVCNGSFTSGNVLSVDSAKMNKILKKERIKIKR